MFKSAEKGRGNKYDVVPEGDQSKRQYLGVIDKKLTPEEEALRQQAIQEYLEEYNSQFRTKSLLE